MLKRTWFSGAGGGFEPTKLHKLKTRTKRNVLPLRMECQENFIAFIEFFLVFKSGKRHISNNFETA